MVSVELPNRYLTAFIPLANAANNLLHMQTFMIEVSPGIFTEYYFADQGSDLFVWHNGTPSARGLSPELLAVFATKNYSVLIPLRPGYGRSSYQPARDFEADATNTAAIVQQLGWASFVTCGYSGGGPRALADLAYNPAARAGIVVAGVAPMFNPEVDWLAGNPEEAQQARELSAAGEAALPNFEKYLPDMKSFTLEKFREQNATDQVLLDWSHTPDALHRFTQPGKTFDQGVTGWMLDEIALTRPWSFEPATITKPTHIWTGDQDKNVPAMCSKWLHEQIPGSTLTVLPGYEHTRIWSIETVTDMLEQLG